MPRRTTYIRVSKQMMGFIKPRPHLVQNSRGGGHPCKTEWVGTKCYIEGCCSAFLLIYVQRKTSRASRDLAFRDVSLVFSAFCRVQVSHGPFRVRTNSFKSSLVLANSGLHHGCRIAGAWLLCTCDDNYPELHDAVGGSIILDVAEGLRCTHSAYRTRQ